MEGLNNVCLVGRLTKDPEMRFTTSGTPVTKITIAVDKYEKDKADFIQCVAWKKLAEIIAEHAKKGMLVSVVGRLETGSYEKENVKHFTTEVKLDYFKILEKKGEQNG